jgi:hypothetical protein
MKAARAGQTKRFFRSDRPGERPNRQRENGSNTSIIGDPMSELLARKLAPYEFRLRTLRAWRAGLIATMIGAVHAGVWVLVARWWALPYAIEGAAAIVVGSGLVTLVVKLLRPLPMIDVARAVDRASGNGDRFSSALELSGTEWAGPVQKDAAMHAVASPDVLFHRRFGHFVRNSIIATAVAAALLLIPGRVLPGGGKKQQTLEGVKPPEEVTQAAEELRRLGELEGDPELMKLGRELELIARDWEEGKIDRKEALARVGEVRTRIREEMEKREAAREALARMAESGASRELAERTAKGDGESAAKEAAEKLGKDAGADAKLGQALEQASREAAQNEELSEALAGAADAARRGDKEGFEKKMEEAREEWSQVAKKGKEKAGAEQRAAEAAGAKEMEKALKQVTEEKAKELAEEAQKGGEAGKKAREELKKAAEAAKKAGEKPRELTQAEKEQAREMGKKKAEEKRESKEPGKGDPKAAEWIRKLKTECEKALGQADGASEKAEGELAKGEMENGETARKGESKDMKSGGEDGTGEKGAGKGESGEGMSEKGGGKDEGQPGTGKGEGDAGSEGLEGEGDSDGDGDGELGQGDPDGDGEGDGGKPGPGGGSKKVTGGKKKEPGKGVNFKDLEVEIPAGPGEGDMTGESTVGPANEGEAQVPFEEVLIKYRAEMEKAMETEAWPEETRKAVRDYFDSLGTPK